MKLGSRVFIPKNLTEHHLLPETEPGAGSAKKKKKLDTFYQGRDAIKQSYGHTCVWLHTEGAMKKTTARYFMSITQANLIQAGCVQQANHCLRGGL